MESTVAQLRTDLGIARHRSSPRMRSSPKMGASALSPTSGSSLRQLFAPADSPASASTKKSNGNSHVMGLPTATPPRSQSSQDIRPRAVSYVADAQSPGQRTRAKYNTLRMSKSHAKIRKRLSRRTNSRVLDSLNIDVSVSEGILFCSFLFFFFWYAVCVCINCCGYVFVSLPLVVFRVSC